MHCFHHVAKTGNKHQCCLKACVIRENQWLWWCLVDGVQCGAFSALHLQSSTNQRTGLSLRHYGKDVRASVRWLGGNQEITHLLFPFKVDQSKSKIKIRNHQVQKKHCKRLLYLQTMIFLKTRYIFTEIKHISETVSHVVFYILSSSSSL